MKVFLTGANGFIGSTIIPELIHAGHQVLGLTRSDAGAKSLTSAGAQVHRGSLEDLNSLRDGASQSDAVIHCAYDTDLSNPVETSRKEAQAIEALGAELQGSDRPLIITSVAGMGARQHLVKSRRRTSTTPIHITRGKQRKTREQLLRTGV
jgi:uncharacterized protein YbjT (DUF2867 family)